MIVALVLDLRHGYRIGIELDFHHLDGIFSISMMMGISLTPAERHRTDKDFHFHHYRRRALNVMLLTLVSKACGRNPIDRLFDFD